MKRPRSGWKAMLNGIMMTSKAMRAVPAISQPNRKVPFGEITQTKASLTTRVGCLTMDTMDARSDNVDARCSTVFLSPSSKSAPQVLSVSLLQTSLSSKSRSEANLESLSGARDSALLLGVYLMPSSATISSNMRGNSFKPTCLRNATTSRCRASTCLSYSLRSATRDFACSAAICERRSEKRSGSEVACLRGPESMAFCALQEREAAHHCSTTAAT
mmetsp:Transcript_47761/g.103977  ORF Transcript_47761/g.103977 Transcript_47761/m.103977 type:complete len:217 (+) Transcript_47761:1515-2165(+)